MPKFDIYLNPNPAATHRFYVDVQSDLVRLSTRWCIPLRKLVLRTPLIASAQACIEHDDVKYVLDTPNLLAVPALLLRQKVGRLSSADQLLAEGCIEFMLRGY
jgi:hypothetical protein